MNNEAINGIKEIIKPITNLFNTGEKIGTSICILLILILIIYFIIKASKKNKNNK